MAGSPAATKDLRILFVSNLFPDRAEPYRGLDNATVLHALAEHHGCEVRALSPRPCLPGMRFKKRLARPEDEPFHPEYVPARYIPRVGSFFNHHLMRRALRSPLQKLRREFDWDVMLVSWLYPDGWAAVRESTNDPSPVVLIAQGSDVHHYLHLAPRRSCIMEAVERSAGVITRSRSLATLLAGAGAQPGKLKPITNGINTSIFTRGDRESVRRHLGVEVSTKLLLYVGNFLEVKSPLMLVKGFARLCAQLPEETLRLVMVGKGPMEAEVLATAAGLGVQDRLKLSGPLLPDEVAAWMQAADLFCMTSKNEGLPNVILEAQACGLPVVSTAVGSIDELVDEPWKGGLCKADDLEGWVEHGKRLLKSSPERARIAEVGGSRTWRKAAAQYHETLVQALEQQPQREP